jgi:flagellar motor switch/type III secretory pathway protein FliN
MAGGAAPALSPPIVGKPRGVGEAESESKNESDKQEARWRPVLELPCQLTVDLPLPGFKLADFLKLQVGSVVATGWRVAQDVPLRINGTLVAWGEFEGAGHRLAVRLTELA